MLTKKVVGIQLSKAKLITGAPVTSVSLSGHLGRNAPFYSVYIHQNGECKSYMYDSAAEALSDYELASSYLGKVP